MGQRSPRLRLAAALLTAGVALAGARAWAAVSDTVRTPHVQAQLVSETTAAAPGATSYVALRLTMIPGWHTYWRNPGDAGQAPSLAWSLPAGWRAGDIVWPAPRRELSGPVMSYVYTGSVDLPVGLAVPPSAQDGRPAKVSATANWLVCKDVCIPESGRLTLTLPVARATPVLEPQGGQAVADALAQAPAPAGLTARFQVDGGALTLEAVGAPLADASAEAAAHAYFFPYDTTALEQAKPERVARGAAGLTLTLPAGYAFTAGKPPVTLAGVLTLAGRAFEVAATPGPAPAGAAAASPAVESTPAPTEAAAAVTPPATATIPTRGAPAGLLPAIALALLGGVVLNLMPCVFPVLAMKAAALARHVERPADARREGVAFLLGVVASLMTLAVALVVARAAGRAVGWGFQMQSPPFVAALVLVVLLAALNLSGVFEVGTSVQGVGAEAAARRGGGFGAFLTGVLAVVVAAPCSAPFMAAALGWALAQPPAAALAVFLALALGLAAPFTAVSFAPRLVAVLPRPGGWMDVLKHALAFPMYATAAWLAWVFALLAGVGALPLLFAAALATAFAAWCWGLAQGRQDEAGSGAKQNGAARGAWPRGLAAAALVAAVGCVVLVGGSAASPATTGGAALPAQPSAVGAASILSQARPWSPETVAALRRAGHPVFVDFTAAWCLTCQVNERTALADPVVRRAFDRTGAVYLKADWTRPDPRIAQALAEQGRSGVPLYLVYAPASDAPARVLPQLLTAGAVAAALDTAHG